MRPSWLLVGAVLGTQVIATVIVVAGFLMRPIPITWALAVWAYALAWLIVNDQVKLLVYRVLARRAVTGHNRAARALAHA